MNLRSLKFCGLEIGLYRKAMRELQGETHLPGTVCKDRGTEETVE
jgi:hypothetical protein